MKVINHERHKLLLERYCNKGKHRLRENNFGVTWCVICGLLSNGEVPDKLTEEDKLFVINTEDGLHDNRTE